MEKSGLLCTKFVRNDDSLEHILRARTQMVESIYKYFDADFKVQELQDVVRTSMLRVYIVLQDLTTGALDD
jgi:uncharacterized membrane protein